MPPQTLVIDPKLLKEFNDAFSVLLKKISDLEYAMLVHDGKLDAVLNSIGTTPTPESHKE
jgi:hypothetical protein